MGRISPQTVRIYKQAGDILFRERKISRAILNKMFPSKRNADLFLTSFENQNNILLYESDSWVYIYKELQGDNSDR